jgi:hypothetical protein
MTKAPVNPFGTTTYILFSFREDDGPHPSKVSNAHAANNKQHRRSTILESIGSMGSKGKAGD